jgi:hypothetical protein
MAAQFGPQLVFVASLLCLYCSLAHAQSIDDLCRDSSGIVAKAVHLKEENASMVTAEGLASTIQNERLRTFLIESIHVAYMHPSYISGMVASGEWQRQCVAYVIAGSD